MDLLESIKKIVVECGSIMIGADYNNLGIEEKDGNNNIVTKYDVMIQEMLKTKLLELVPSAIFIGEEGFFSSDVESEYAFIVDPIDGTLNFSRNLALSAISVALLKNDKPYIAVCYNPYINELYYAMSGKGAFLNGNRIHVSDKNLKNGIVSCGCAPYYDDLRKQSLKLVNKFASVASDFRRFGSAVIEICNVACGKVEVYFELKLMPWDYAAASLILTEAGGVITTIEGSSIQYYNPTSVLVSNGVENYLEYIR